MAMDYFEHLMRHTADFFHRMLAHGIIRRDEDVELQQGLLIFRVGTGERGLASAARLARALHALPEGSVRAACEELTFVDASPESVVRPISVVRSPSGDLCGVVEVCDQLPSYYRGNRARIFARHRVPAYWVVDVIEQMIEVYTSPTGPIDSPHYSKREVYRIGDSVPLVLDGSTVGTIAVADVMA